MSTIRFVTVDPGHFHAALVQKEMYPHVSPQVHVYAPLGADLAAHVNRIIGFNTRSEKPTTWALEVHAAEDFLRRFQQERPGNVVVLSGRNRAKIDYILAALEAGVNVLADKPWVIETSDLPKLAAAFDLASKQGLVAYDIMTERHEITSILQRELLQDGEVFGEMVPGDEESPGVFMESMHFLMKQVAGVPLRRPAWFFDIHQVGEGLTDVGTHLVDLVMWMLHPEQSIDLRDIDVRSAKRWPTSMTKGEFQRVTGEAEFPDCLASALHGGRLDYFCNTRVSYRLRGVHVTLNVLWNYEAAAGAGDTHLAVFRGTRSTVEVRQDAEQRYRPEVYVVPRHATEQRAVKAALEHRIAALQPRYPGVAVDMQGDRLHVTIPDRYRIGHEAHFAEVTRQFLEYLAQPRTLPAWENPNMFAKYHVTTRGIEQARQGPS